MGKPSESSIGRYSADRKTAFFFGLPFGVAGRILRSTQARQDADRRFSLANEEEPLEYWGSFGQEWMSGYEEPHDAYAVVACMLMYISIAMENYTRQAGYT